MYNKIQKLIDAEEYEKALKWTTKLLESNNTDVQGWIFKARIYIDMEKDEEAIKSIKKCEELDSHHPFVPLLWSQLYIIKATKEQELKDNHYFEEALKYADNALAINNKYFDALITKAQLLFWIGDEKYKEIVEQCYTIDKKRTENFMKNCWIDKIPNTHPFIILNEGLRESDNLIKKGLFEEAQNKIEKLLPLNMEKKMKEVLYSMRIECLICQEKFADAERETEKLIEYSPNYPMAYFHKAVIYWKLKKDNEAMIWIDQTIQCAEKENMQHPQFYNLKAAFLKKQGDKEYGKYEQLAKEIQKKNMKMFKKLQESIEDEDVKNIFS